MSPHDRVLGPDDLDGYLRLREGSFGFPAGDEALDAFRARLPNAHGAFVDGQLAAVVTQHPYRAWVAGRCVPVGGFGGVATAPEHRRAGHVARLMRAALDAGRAQGFGWNLLYPFDAAFYGRYGWVSVPTGVPLALPPERLPPGAPGRLTRVEGPARAGLAEPYARFAATRTFADARTGGPWDAWEDLDAAPGQRLLRFAGTDAFVAVKLRDDAVGVHLDVLDLGWCDAAGRDAVWGVLAAFRGQVAVVHLEAPWDDPVTADRQRAHAVTGHAGLMARIADVATTAAALRAVADDDAALDLAPLTLQVIDAHAPWNEGTWRLTPGPEGTEIKAARGPADATVDVRGLALLWSGAAAPADVRRAGWAEGDGRALATLAALSGGRRPFRSPVDRF
ncbi:MAG: enhanced intracellular survival protein Eis [Trueperaceae bacterium]